MLLVDLIDANGQPVQILAGRVVVRDISTSTPLAVAAVTSHRGYEVSSAGAPDFHTVLAKVGIPPVKVTDGKKLRNQPGIL